MHNCGLGGGNAPARAEHDFAAHSVGDAKLVEQSLDMQTARTFLRSHERTYGEERASECINSRDVRCDCTPTHRDAKAGPTDIFAGLAANLAFMTSSSITVRVTMATSNGVPASIVRLSAFAGS